MSLKEKTAVVILSIIMIIFTIVSLSTDYFFFTYNNYSRNLKVDFRQRYKDNLDWINTVDSVYTLSDSSYNLSINYLNQLAKEKLTDTTRLKDIYYIKANILYQNNRINFAIQTLENYNKLTKFQTSKYLSLKAGCLIKQDKLSEAEALLKVSAEDYIDSKWYLGNFYEIMRNKQEAIKYYQELLDYLNNMKSLRLNSPFYPKCKDRIKILKEANPIYLDAIVYLDDRKRSIMRAGGRGFIVSQEF